MAKEETHGSVGTKLQTSNFPFPTTKNKLRSLIHTRPEKEQNKKKVKQLWVSSLVA